MRGKKTEYERENTRVGEDGRGKKSIATPGVTTSVIALKSEGSEFLSRIFERNPHTLCLLINSLKKSNVGKF